MATCPKCGSGTPTKRKNPHKHYYCQRHGFIRWIGEKPEEYTKEGKYIGGENASNS